MQQCRFKAKQKHINACFESMPQFPRLFTKIFQRPSAKSIHRHASLQVSCQRSQAHKISRPGISDAHWRNSSFGQTYWSTRIRTSISPSHQGSDARPIQVRKKWWTHINVGNSKPGQKFLFSYGVSLPLVSGDPAVIVELVRCHIYDDGRADVTIVPVMHCRINSTWEREGSYRLMEAEATAAPRVRQRSPVSLGDPQFAVGPVFHMHSSNSPQLGIEFRLRLFEPRYFSMMAELTQDLDETYRTGVAIPHSSSNFGSNRKIFRPQFIYAYRRNYSPDEEALVVEVRRCHVKGDMTANVTCVAIQKGTVETVEESPNTLQAAKVTVRIRESLDSI